MPNDSARNIEGIPVSLTSRLTGLVTAISYVLYAQIIIALVAIILGFFESQLLSAFEQGQYASLEAAFAEGELVITLLQLTGIASLIAFIVSAVLILKWIYQANANARQLGALNMSYTPTWSIAYFFIPIFNIWKPYLAMKEIWMASKNPLDWKNAKTNFILPLWWAVWLASNLLNQSVFRLSADAVTLSELTKLNMLSQFSNLLDIPLALVTLALIKAIYRMQHENL